MGIVNEIMLTQNLSGPYAGLQKITIQNYLALI